MTKKDYEAFATIIKDNLRSYGYHQDEYEDGRTQGYNDALEDIAHNMCTIFAADNERFDKKIFLKACGI